MLSKMLKRRGIKHEVLNAKQHQREAQIVAQAGQADTVTIATNMAGRGTDIKLGPGVVEPLCMNPETGEVRCCIFCRLDCSECFKWADAKEPVARRQPKWPDCADEPLCGLHIVGTERHEARRIDNQLRGRSGRQGDPGSSRFFLSLEDDLMRLFAGEWVSNFLKRLGMGDDVPIESRMVSRRIQAAQKKVEERNFNIRKNLLEYDGVMDEQRKIVYGQRQDILAGEGLKDMVLEMIDETITAAVDDAFTPREERSVLNRAAIDRAVEDAYEAADADDNEDHRVDTRGLCEWLGATFEIEVDPDELADLDQHGAGKLIRRRVEEAEGQAADAAGGEDAWDAAKLALWARAELGIEMDPDELAPLKRDEVVELVTARAHGAYEAKEHRVAPEGMRGLERFLLLQALDTHWKDHLYAVDQLKSGIGLRGYAQVDPKVEYKREAYEIFDDMIAAVRSEVTGLIFKVEVAAEEQEVLSGLWSISSTEHSAFEGYQQARAAYEAAIAQDQSDEQRVVDPIRRAVPKVGRNDPCPCGSGKKYKKCCGVTK